MPPPPKKPKKCEEGAAEWFVTYGDMVTLLLTFFIMLFNTATVDGSELRMILAAFQGLGTLDGGNTLQQGKMAELGNSIMALPSQERGRALDKARKRAESLFKPHINTQKVRIKEDERGLIISLAADAFFEPASAKINIEEAREVLQNLADLLRSPDLSENLFRIEGHTDNIPTDPKGKFYTNWELSTARSTNTLHYLVDYGVADRQFQVSGFADKVPLYPNDTPEGRAKNRRIDVVILSDAHL